MAGPYILGKVDATNAANETSTTVSNPSTTSGDVLVAVVTTGNGLSHATPTGWTLLNQAADGYVNSFVYTRAASTSAPSVTFDWGGSSFAAGGIAISILAVRGGRAPTVSSTAATSTASNANSVSIQTSPVAVSVANSLVLAAFGASQGSSRGLSWNAAPSGWSVSDSYITSSRSNLILSKQSQVSSSVSVTEGFSNTYYTTQSISGLMIVLAPSNQPPNAPTLTAPADGATVDLNAVQRFALTPSDPDAGDSTSQTWWRHRLIGAPAWTTVTQTSPLTYIDFAAGTFAAGDYEWQAATRDAQGAPTNDADLKWSTSSFFTAATAPAEPTITAPINGGTVSSSETVAWSAPNEDAYELRRVRDNAGTADTATVYYDTGEVVTTTARSRPVTFETNNRYEHIQVRIKTNGLWSSWASVRVLVSFTPPTTPVATLTPDAATGSLLVGITNPAPGAGVPATSYNDVYVDDGDGEERRATMLAPNSTWTYWTPKSGRDYDGKVRVVAVGSNGATASS